MLAVMGRTLEGGVPPPHRFVRPVATRSREDAVILRPDTSARKPRQSPHARPAYAESIAHAVRQGLSEADSSPQRERLATAAKDTSTPGYGQNYLPLEAFF